MTEPSHGTRARYNGSPTTDPCRCQDCRDACARYERIRQWDLLNGRPRTVDATGARRRLQALCALGWDWHSLARHAGVSPELVRIWSTLPGVIYTRNADRVRVLYDQLSMTLPPQDTRGQRNAAARARNRAKRRGWPPPLAWDDGDIDNPDAVAHGYEPTGATTEIRATRVAELEHFYHLGYGIDYVCDRLGTNRKALEKWCERHGHTELYLSFTDRTRQKNNGHTINRAAS